MNLRNSAVTLGIAFASLGVSNSAAAQSGQEASTSADSQAVLIKPITITKQTDLIFGRLASVAGTVSIAAKDGSRTSTNSQTPVAANGGTTPGRATFKITGEPGLTYAISGGTGTIDLKSDANTLTVTLTGVYVLSKSAIGTVGELSVAGDDLLGVGGSIPILATTPSGTYSNAGGIALTVNYN